MSVVGGHSHTHEQGAHGHHHGNFPSGQGLWMALTLTLIFALIEGGAGLWAHSLALLSDALHMMSDTLALGLSLFAVWIARRPPSARHSYGFVRTEILVALINSVILLGVVTAIVVAAIHRFQHPQPVAGGVVMIVALLGLLINAVVAYTLSRGEQTLNTKSAILHVMGDMLGSGAALIAGAVIVFTGFLPIDPILSLVISGLIVYSTLRLLREAVNILMEGVPAHLDLNLVGVEMAAVPGVVSVHDLHIWTLSSGTLALSAHIVIEEGLLQWNPLLRKLQVMLHAQFAIDHVTLQPEVLLSRHPTDAGIIPIHFKP